MHLDLFGVVENPGCDMHEKKEGQRPTFIWCHYEPRVLLLGINSQSS